MKRRRINWTRVILKWMFIICLVGYVAVVLTGFVVGLPMNDSVPADTTAPVIEMRGGEAMTIAVGDAWVEPGVVVYDDRSIPEMTLESEVDVAREGEYKVRYEAVDAEGNRSEKERTVKVIRPAGKIYLTFDDGPSDYTAALLDALKKYGVRATFFVTGYGDDALIKREYDEGHAVGVHTFSHVYANIYSSVDNYVADFDQVKGRVRAITGCEPRLMRFPGGSSNLISARYDGGVHIMTRLVGLMDEWGYKYFDWNVDSGDAGGASSADEVYANVVNALKPGGDSVVLQHDTKPYSVEAVERIIQFGLENNYVFDRLSESSFPAHHGVNN